MKTNLILSQKQCVSKKMLQSINILQMNNMELNQYINNLHLENPVVNIDNPYTGEEDYEKKLEWLTSTFYKQKIYCNKVIKNDNQTNTKSLIYDESLFLTKILFEQLHMLNIPKKDIKICEFIIENLDEYGFLDCKEQIKSILNLSTREMNKYIKILQSLEPAGVASININECLILQLERSQQIDTLTKNIIHNDLEMLSKKQFTNLKNKYGITKDRAIHILNTIKHLNPRPYTPPANLEPIKYITPDVTVVKFENFFEVLLNNYNTPNISINTYYLNILKTDIDKKTKKYITSKIDQCIYVQNCINQRNSTLFNVVTNIVELQAGFFLNGHGHLIPLKMKEVAKKLSVNESTISRAIKNKYLQCSFGVFPIKYFFANQIQSEGSIKLCTPEKVKVKIQTLIKAECPRNPLNDIELTKLLNEVGFKITRRTVSKYRTELKYPVASARKNL